MRALTVRAENQPFIFNFITETLLQIHAMSIKVAKHDESKN